MILGINASRARSGGAMAHLKGILSEGVPSDYGFTEVHVWSYPELLAALPERPWLVKKSHIDLTKSIFRQVWWERFTLPKEICGTPCSIILNVDAGTLCRFKPAVTMSRDMQAFEPGEMRRLFFSKAFIRQVLLHLIQTQSLKNADGAIFLTDYAANIIQKSCGLLKNWTIIPHGIGKNFTTTSSHLQWPIKDERPIHCLYVSNVALYKHQWHVVDAIEQLRKNGCNIVLELIGGGTGKAKKKLESKIMQSDPQGKFVHQSGFLLHQELPSRIANSDIFVFASSCENMPNTLVEAMAAGIPIACSNRGPMPEILQDGGVYFDPEKPKSISKAIKQIITDAKMRTKIAARAKKLSQQYSWERCAKETFTFLSETAIKTSR